MGANLRTLLSSSLTAGSRRSYQLAWIIFRQFYLQFYASDDPLLPVPSTCLCLFISYLISRKLAPSSVTSYLSAISYVHKLRGLHDPTKSFLNSKAINGSQQSTARGGVDIRLPVTRPVLRGLVRALSFTNCSVFQRSLFSAVFLVAFYGLFRIGELTSKSDRFASSVIQFSSVT